MSGILLRWKVPGNHLILNVNWKLSEAQFQCCNFWGVKISNLRTFLVFTPDSVTLTSAKILRVLIRIDWNFILYDKEVRVLCSNCWYGFTISFDCFYRSDFTNFCVISNSFFKSLKFVSWPSSRNNVTTKILFSCLTHLNLPFLFVFLQFLCRLSAYKISSTF